MPWLGGGENDQSRGEKVVSQRHVIFSSGPLLAVIMFVLRRVAEVDPDEELAEDDNADLDGTNMCTALGIGGTAMSKGELASLIRFGANAVYDSRDSNGSTGDDSSNQISDMELDTLLERPGGRDATLLINCASSGLSSKSVANTEASSSSGLTDRDASVIDPIERAQQALRERMELMKEIDLRQLDDVVYQKKPTTRESSGDLAGLTDELIGSLGKRIRKERIVMVNAKGSGYGGAVPVLSDNLEASEPMDDPDGEAEGGRRRGRGRQWQHMDFCVLCGKQKTPSQIEAAKEEKRQKKKKRARFAKRRSSKVEAIVPEVEFPDATIAAKCAHCPIVVHFECASAFSLPTRAAGGRAGGSGSHMFCCPHHKCCSCLRSTASAGGMLFRCTGCLTAYCEDCLPQDEIDSVGRCRELEELGYESKQSYFIRCPSCCLSDSDKKAAEIVEVEAEESQIPKEDEVQKDEGEAPADADSVKDDGGKDGDPDADAEGEVFLPNKTQLMRIFWAEAKEEEVEVEEEVDISDEIVEERDKLDTGSSKSQKKRRFEEDQDDDSSEDWSDIESYIPDVPEQVNPEESVSHLAMHPAFKRLLILMEWRAADNSGEFDVAVEASNIFNHATSKLAAGD